MNVAITGVTGGIGRLLAERLSKNDSIDEIIGIGRKKEDPIISTPKLKYKYFH